MLGVFFVAWKAVYCSKKSSGNHSPRLQEDFLVLVRVYQRKYKLELFYPVSVIGTLTAL